MEQGQFGSGSWRREEERGRGFLPHTGLEQTVLDRGSVRQAGVRRPGAAGGENLQFWNF